MPVAYGAGIGPVTLAVEDFNGDERPDLAVGNRESDDVSILINTGLFKCWDDDGDGHADEVCGGCDCDDSDPEVHPGRPEVLSNGKDDDCDGQVDEICFIEVMM